MPEQDLETMARSRADIKSVRTSEDACRLGRVWLVGAGPGAPDLITQRGQDLLKSADVVVYDALILPETLKMIPEGTEKIYVGKRAGAHSVPQKEIQEILIREAELGKRVVRLKGGDPFVFGRGGEETLALAERGIPCEAVPGVTSAVAVPEAFGIPVTHRGLADSFTVITGHGQAKSMTEEADRIDYEALVRTGGTLIFLMGLSAAGKICRGLTDAGMEPGMPAAALSKGTTAAQRMVLSTVGCLEEDIRAAKLEAPAVLMVGKVCSLAPVLGCGDGDEKTSFREEKTSGIRKAGVTVVVTRQAEKAGAFSARLKDLGMNVLELPAIRIRMPEETHRQNIIRAMHRLCGKKQNPENPGLPGSEDRENQSEAVPEEKKKISVDWLVFSSSNGADAFFDLLIGAGLDIRSLLCGSEKRFAAVGPKTAEALEKHGILPDLVPQNYTGEALGEALCRRIEEDAVREKTGSREPDPICPAKAQCWFFGANRTDGGLEAALAAHDIPLECVPVYETVSAVNRDDAEKLAEQILKGAERFLFTFTSASCVKNLAAALAETGPGSLSGQPAVCIGEKTAKAARQVGMLVTVSKESTEESMLEEIQKAARVLASGN